MTHRHDQLATDLHGLISSRARAVESLGDDPSPVIALTQLIRQRREQLATTPGRTWGRIRVYYTEPYYGVVNTESADDMIDPGIEFDMVTREWSAGNRAPRTTAPLPFVTLQWKGKSVAIAHSKHSRREPPSLELLPLMAADDLIMSRRDAACVVVGGRLLEFGGFGYMFATSDIRECVEDVDAKTYKWVKYPHSMITQMIYVSAIEMHGYVYIIGGSANNEDAEFGYYSVGGCSRFDPDTGTWTACSMPNNPKDGYSYNSPLTAVRAGDAIFMMQSHCRGEPFGGDDWNADAWLYWPYEDRWEQLPTAPYSVPGITLEWVDAPHEELKQDA